MEKVNIVFNYDMPWTLSNLSQEHQEKVNGEIDTYLHRVNKILMKY